MAQIGLRFLGNSAFEILSEKGVRVLIDPHITGNRLCPISVDELQPPDLILVSHAAEDHMSDAPELVKKFQCSVVCDPGVAYLLKTLGVPKEKIVTMVWGHACQYHGLKVRVVESKHISFYRDGPMPITGLPLSFILYTESNLGVYHSGDTSIFSDLKLFGELYKPDIGCILVGNYPGSFPELSPHEAALAVKWLKLKVAVPMHFDIGSLAPQEFVECVKDKSPKTQALIINPGEWRYFQTNDFSSTALGKPSSREEK